MADKSDARAWLIEQDIDMHRMLHLAPDKIVQYLTAYAAAVTQERDALRRHLEWALDVIWDDHHVGHGILDVGFVNDSDKEQYVTARAAAEESQPK